MVARPGELCPVRHEFLSMLSEAMLRERVAPDFVSQGWDERVIRRECLRQGDINIAGNVYLSLGGTGCYRLCVT